MLKAQERRLRLQQMKGELVDRARAVAQVFRLARDERDAWVNWPAGVAAMIAAELEIDPHQLHTVLERQVRDQPALTIRLEGPGYAQQRCASPA